MSSSAFRASNLELERTKDLIGIIKTISENKSSALDVGARDGHFSKLLAGYFPHVTALDLDMPEIPNTKINCVIGDVTQLEFSDNEFNLVFCAEVLEHIPSHILKKACHELSRVTKEYLLIGVPYKQDIRLGRTTCSVCKGNNPAWGHVNNFNKTQLINLFPSLSIEKITYVGSSKLKTNLISTFLMDKAGNPFGTYEQEEKCIHCGGEITAPKKRNLLQKLVTKIAFHLTKFQGYFARAHPNWIHILFIKRCEKC